jgi:hypothetical protein
MSTKTARTGGASLSLNVLAAGIIGAICTDAFISIAHQSSPVKIWQFIASAGFGPVAFQDPAFIWIGLVMHLIIAIVWAFLYVLVWSRVNSLRNWVVGGLVWGIVVDVVMDGLMALRGILEPQTTNVVVFGLITNVIFYGLPVAWYISRTVPTTRQILAPRS